MRITDNKKTNQAEYTFNAAYFLIAVATGTIGLFFILWCHWHHWLFFVLWYHWHHWLFFVLWC
ncbi:hypothetical protein ACS86R_005115, partial [Escherichia coli]